MGGDLVAWLGSCRLTAALAVCVVASLGARPGWAEQAATGDQVGAHSPSAPLARRANQLLPSWLKVRGEFRERLEAVENFGFATERDDLYWLSRLRLEATLTPAPFLRFHVQAQDARVAGKSFGPMGTPFSAPIDLRSAYAEVGNVRSRVAVRVGRQELAFGEQRLLGHLNWTNAARSFDAVRGTVRTTRLQLDLFESSVVRVLPGVLDRSGAGERLGGAYASTNALLPHATVEPYLLWRRQEVQRGERGSLGDLSVATSGVRVNGRLGGRADYDIELAMQRGSQADDTVSAWASHWRLRETLAGRSPTHVIAEYNFASGDAEPLDGVRGTFDQLYPTGHDKYGLADQVGWRNIHHLRLGVDFTPVRGFPVTTSYHSWWLAQRADALYSAGGVPIARIPGGAIDRHVGQEVDVQVVRALTPQLQLAAGYAHMFTGPFLDRATPGASYSFPYVMATYVFLAER